jgi:hypothetical protein
MEYLRDDGCWSALWQQLGDVAVKGKPIFFFPLGTKEKPDLERDGRSGTQRVVASAPTATTVRKRTIHSDF